MQEINKVISAASFRLGLANFFTGFIYCLTGAIVLALLARIAQQLFGLTIPWAMSAYIAAGAVVLGACIWALVVRPNKDAVARRVDEGANLKESLSTALAVASQKDDPWAKVTVESAVRQARGVNVSQAVPITAPRFWPVPFALALAFAVLWMALPKWDVLGWQSAKIAKEQENVAKVELAKAEAEVKKMEEAAEKLGIEKDKTEPPAADKPEQRDPEAIRRSVIKDLTKLNERLEQLRNGEKGQKLDAINNALKQLKEPGKQTSELSKALQTGNFQQAQKELEKMKEQLSTGQLSDDQKQQLSDQMDNLSKQLEELAKNKDELEKALKEAGLDSKLAENPQALKEAMEKAQNLTPEQKQQLQEMAQSMGQCQSAMDALSQAASQMSQAAKSGDQQAAEQAASQMSDQLSQLEQLSQEMSLAEAAQNECQNKMDSMCKGGKEGEGEGECNGEGEGQGQGQGQGQGNKPWQQGWSMNQGNGGRGGPGLGQGGSANSEKADFDTQKKKDIGKMGSGPIVSSRLVEGDSIKGESHAEFVKAASGAEQGATEAIENNLIPREYHDAIKNYFGNLKKGGKSAPAQDAKPAEPAKPTEPAKDAGK